MRWFKHDVDMHTDLKVQALIAKHGLEGYAVWNLCLELLGKEGHKGKLDGQTRWQEGLLKVCGWSSNDNDKVKLNDILESMVELKLICSKSFKYGNLYIPNFLKRVDNWERRKLGSDSEVSYEALQHRIDKNRIDKIRLNYISLKGWKAENFTDYARTAKAIKALIDKAKGKDEVVLKALQWASRKDWCDWTLETVAKKWADFMKSYERITYVPPPLAPLPPEGERVPREQVQDLIKTLSDKKSA